MSEARLTDERLRSWLNSDQASRERLCLAVLACDRQYRDLQPRRPEGGRDGGRDIQATRDAQLCFGAVGFLNCVSDSPQDKREIKKKFRDDVAAAVEAEPKLRAFVFLTNVDLTPGETTELKDWAVSQGLSFVDIYWRERIRGVLDGPEGLAARFQYLGISLSEAEQQAFFSRFGKDLETIVHGRLDSVERKIDALEYALWRTGTIREISLELKFRQWIDTPWESPLHFRVLLELQSIVSQGRSIFLGGRDDFWRANDAWYFGTKVFFWRQKYPQQESVWFPQRISAGGGITTSIKLGVQWLPRSVILVEEFRGLRVNLLVTENIVEQLASVEMMLDSYVIVSRQVNAAMWKAGGTRTEWPGPLTPAEEAIGWKRLGDLPFPLYLGRTPEKRDSLD